MPGGGLVPRPHYPFYALPDVTLSRKTTGTAEDTQKNQPTARARRAPTYESQSTRTYLSTLDAATQLNYGNNIFLWTVVNGNCRDSASINIFKRDSIDCLANIKLPSAFSPNGDGFNDRFIVRGIEDFPDNSFVVFNRWGQTVFESNGYNNEWDGRSSSGEQLTDGTYFVILKVKLNGKVYNTYVDLRR